MKEKKKSAVSWILTWAGQKRIAYVWSVLLAIGNVIFKILPYFLIFASTANVALCDNAVESE